jgi:hypothetical protein
MIDFQKEKLQDVTLQMVTRGAAPEWMHRRCG